MLQRVHPIFQPSVHCDIAAVTAHLADKGFRVPHLVPSGRGELSVSEESGCWRLQTFIHGSSFHVMQSIDMAHQSGQLVGQFHAAINDLKHDYYFSRDEAHNTPLYVSRLKLALINHKTHHLYPSAVELGTSILNSSESLPNLWLLNSRHSHGDLKVSNLLFDDAQKCVSIVDWDTSGRLPWPLEVGDALRSWSNTQGEDSAKAAIDKEIFSAALNGYARYARGLWSVEEKGQVVNGLLVITLELAARFLADALVEKYFSYDADKFSSLGHHNLVRARSQWRLHQEIRNEAAKLQHIVQRELN